MTMSTEGVESNLQPQGVLCANCNSFRGVWFNPTLGFEGPGTLEVRREKTVKSMAAILASTEDRMRYGRGCPGAGTLANSTKMSAGAF